MNYFNMGENMFKWLNEDSKEFLKRGYLEEKIEPIDRIREIRDEFERRSRTELADKFFEYMSKGWISLSSPIWSNYGTYRGLPISCFGGTLQDSTEDILRGISETGMLSKFGGGTAQYFGNIRPRGSEISRGGKTNGSVAFMQMYDSMMEVITQGNVRRGSMAAYLPIDHGDIEEFLNIRSDDSKIQNLSIAVTIPEGWMQSMIDGDTEKRKLWAKVLKKRSDSGYPYIYFKDNVNENKPKVYKDKGMELNHSQLCAEIHEYTDENKTFTCCLSSLNLKYYEEWKDTDLVEVMMYFLDTVLDEFIEKAQDIPYLEKALLFAKEHRSVGLGVLGWHTYLQDNMIPMEGFEAKQLLNKMFKNISNKTLEASKKISEEKGEPKMLEGYGERFTTRMAIAPTTSSSFILGQVSPSIEPLNSNYFIKDLAKGKFVYKNPKLKEILKDRNKDTAEVWKSILEKGGSVQHLNFLSDREKSVFKTFGEISQLEIIQNASIVQKYVDQGISLNLMIHPLMPAKEINKLMIEAWRLGLKTLYYQRSANMAQELSRELMQCVSCEG